MLTMQNLRKNIYSCINNISQKSYPNYVILVSIFSIVAIIFLNMYGFEGAGKSKNTMECSSIKERKEEVKTDHLEENKIMSEGGFATSCQDILKIEQDRIKEKAQKKKRETIAVCASIETMHNEIQQEPVNPYGDIFISDEDYEALLRIVQAEAGGEDEQGKILVAEVILNRVLAKDFASTVYGVIFERSGGSPQFAPTADGRYYSVEVTQKTIEAVDKALKDEDLSQGALFFSARSKANPYDMAWFDKNLKWLFQYGGHEFYTLP